MKRPDLTGLAEIFAKNPDLQRRNAHLRVNGPLQAIRDVEIPEGYDAMVVRVKTPPTKTKYRNKVVIDAEHGRFDSQKEFKRFLELKVLERAGEIKSLERQHRIKLEVSGQPICVYVADFKYLEQFAPEKWHIVIEDSKGFRTKEYKLKKKLVRAIYGIDIRET